jgi:multiple sugar transport system permease protein
MAERRLTIAGAPVGRVRMRRLLGSDYRLAYLFILPLLALVLGLIAYPFLYAIYLSFTEKPVGELARFIGLRNYIRLASDRAFQQAVVNSFVFTGFAVALKLLLGLVMALVLHSRIKWSSFWSALLLIPWVTPTVVASLNWLWMYDATLGIINYVLTSLNLISQPVGWLSERSTAMAAVVIANVWRGFPFFGISLLAGLKVISDELYEAAQIDGASVWQRFQAITLPQLRNVIIITTLLSTIWTFNDFQIIWIMTKGGPGNATQIFATLSYEVAFGAQRLGEAVAISIYLMPALALVIVALAKYMRRDQQVQ